jgi:hypothetical protein
MMAWVVASGGVRAIGDSGDVLIETAGWRERPAGPSMASSVEETLTGTLSGLRIPTTSATVSAVDEPRKFSVGNGLDLFSGEYVLECSLSATPTAGACTDQGSVMGFRLRFEGPASIRERDGELSVSLLDETPVALGFTEQRSDPASITVPPTPDGVSTAISHLSASLRTTGPERSHPSMRDHPPIVDCGEETSIPAAVRDATPDTGIELRVPPELEYCFVGAPLAYYLGATMTVTEEAAPRLVAPSADVEYRFRRLPTFQQGVTRLLRQVFFFDTLVRDVDGEPVADRETQAAAFGLEPSRLRDLSPAARLAKYFWVSTGDLSAALPEWHFSTYLAPEAGNVSPLSYLLDALSLLYLPEYSPVHGPDLLERSLDEYYRSGSQSDSATPRQLDVVQPARRAGRIQGWFGPGAPIDAFKTTPAAFENRRTYRGRWERPLSVTVVLNDDAMSDEHAAVSEIYRDRSADLPLAVTVEEDLSRAALASVFETPTDFVHYIGHCDQDGLECADGSLSVSTLEASRARTFFLNACGSYHEGLELVERGSVGGAVTLTDVLDRQAAKVGTAFARLLVHGFGLEPAMQLSRRRIMMGKDYATVGDGTYTLAPSSGSPVVGWLEHRADGYTLSCEAVSARQNGDTFVPPFASEPVLHGRTAEADLSATRCIEVLRADSFPVIYEGDFHWSTDLADVLAPP